MAEAAISDGAIDLERKKKKNRKRISRKIQNSWFAERVVVLVYGPRGKKKQKKNVCHH